MSAKKKCILLVIKDYKSIIILPWSDICHPFLSLSLFLSPNWMRECVQMLIEPRSMAWMSLFQPTPVTLTTARCLSWCSASLWTTDSMTPTLAWWGKALYQCNRDCLRLCKTSPILRINVGTVHFCKPWKCWNFTFLYISNVHFLTFQPYIYVSTLHFWPFQLYFISSI